MTLVKRSSLDLTPSDTLGEEPVRLHAGQLGIPLAALLSLRSSRPPGKHALIGLTRCVALEVARSGVTVNAVCPGLVDTSMAQALLEAKARATGTDARSVRGELVTRRIPIGRLIDPAEIGPLVAYLLSPAAAGMTGSRCCTTAGRCRSDF